MWNSEARPSKFSQRVSLSGSVLMRGVALVCLSFLAFGHAPTARGDTGDPTAASQERAQQNVANYTQRPEQVSEAVTAALVERGELTAATAREANNFMVRRFGQGEPGQVGSQSMDVDRERLLGMVAEPFRKFVGDAGGRYVVNVTVEQTATGGARVTVVPTIIATVREADGPLGGRVLRSSGTIEAAILQAVSARLGG